MVEQRIWGVIAIAAVFGLGTGCDDKKEAAEEAAAAAAKSAEAAEAVEDAEEPKKPPEPEPVATVNPMVLIPAGSFTMGSTDGQDDEKPARRTRVAAFEMDVTEVTYGAYLACIAERKCTYPDRDSFCVWGRKDRRNHPMNCVDWDQATAYCESVGKRLPTEEEWEYAARGAEGRKFPWGEGPPPEGLCFKRSRRGTCPVDAVPVDSPFGLRGMAGNVWEWTSSGYNENYSKKRETNRRVYRGGSFSQENVEELRASLRNMRYPNTRFDYIGFRCARTPKAGGK